MAPSSPVSTQTPQAVQVAAGDKVHIACKAVARQGAGLALGGDVHTCVHSGLTGHRVGLARFEGDRVAGAVSMGIHRVCKRSAFTLQGPSAKAQLRLGPMHGLRHPGTERSGAHLLMEQCHYLNHSGDWNQHILSSDGRGGSLGAPWEAPSTLGRPAPLLLAEP